MSDTAAGIADGVFGWPTGRAAFSKPHEMTCRSVDGQHVPTAGGDGRDAGHVRHRPRDRIRT
jgi:hypothetical protein